MPTMTASSSWKLTDTTIHLYEAAIASVLTKLVNHEQRTKQR